MNKTSVRAELVSRFYAKNHCTFFTALIISMLSGTTGPIVSWILKGIIDLMSGQGHYTLQQMAMMCIGFTVFTLMLTVINYHSEPRFVSRAMRQFKDRAFCILSKKNIASFRQEETSTYLSALTNDATSIETDYVASVLPIVSETVSLVVSVALMLYYSPALTAVAVLITVIPASISAVMGRKMAKAQKAVSDRNTDFVATITDCLGGFQVIKSFRAEKEAYMIFESGDRKLEDTKCHLRKITGAAGALGAISGAVAQFGVFLAGTYLVLNGKGVTAGSVMMFVNLMNFMVSPVSKLPKLLAGKKASSALIDKLSSALEKNADTKGTLSVGTVGEAINFQNVSFAYDDKKEVLHDVTCSFLPGRSYAIVGSSGSGKSTLLNLLTSGDGKYGGSITIDGKELSSVNIETLYDIMTVIQQNVFIFNSSIRDNVTMFRGFEKPVVDAALAQARLTELIEEKGDGYLCGENGKGLSGGEKQRISIARGLLKKSRILLADEITSSLDAKTSHEVINGILDLDSMTRIVVTHSLEEQTLKRFDEIIVLKNGTIEEKGDFKSLMENDGYFKALFTVAKS